MSEIKVGDEVLYSPDHCHATLKLSQVQHRFGKGTDDDPFDHGYLFHYRHLEHGARNLGDGKPVHHKKGDPVQLHAQEGLRLEKVNGVLHTHDGHPVTPSHPKQYWAAKVLRVNDDGTCDLEIRQPGASVVGDMVVTVMHQCPDRENHPDAPGIPHDPKKAPHTFHLPGE